MKCLSAFAVICIHCTLQISGKFGQILDALMRFAVPVFFLISGYYSFFNKGDIAKQKYKTRIFKIIKLIIISNLLYFTYNIIINQSYNEFLKIISNKFTAKNNFFYLILNASPSSGHLWFLNALLYCYILFLLMNKFKISYKRLYQYIPILLITNVTLGEIIQHMNIHITHIYYRNFLFTGLPFFTLGYLIHDKQKKIEENISNKFIIVTMILSTILIIIERLATGKVELHIGTIFFSIIIFIWCVINPEKLKFRILGWIGEKLYTNIYILQTMIIELVIKCENNLKIPIENACYLNTIIVFIIATIISSIIYNLGKLVKKKNIILKSKEA